MSISSQIVASIGPGPDRLALCETLARAEPTGIEDWSGASGKQYMHVVYGLIECPPMPSSNYMLVRRQDDGHRVILKVAHVSHEAPTLNLAQIRHEGALLGANEVHLHLLARTEADRILVEFDIGAQVRADVETATAAALH